MNGKELLDKMSEVDPKLIEGAYKEAEKPKSKRALFIGLSSGMAAVAAALAIVIGINASNAGKISVGNHQPTVDGIESLPATNGGSGNEENSADKGGIDEASVSGTLGTQAPETVDNIKPEAVIDGAFVGFEDLPMISNCNYGINGFGNGPTGSGVYSVYDGGEPETLETFGPWGVATHFTTLPVFRSNSTAPKVDKMTERVKSAAAILGIPEGELEIVNRGLNVGDLDSYRKILEEYGLSEEEIEAELERVGRYSAAQGSIEGKSDRATIYAYTDGSIWIDFKEPNPEMPEGYDLNEQDPSPDVMAATVEYFAEEYKELLGYQNPKVARYEGNFEYEYGVYEGEVDSSEDQLVNYWLKYCEFLVDWEIPNGLEMLRVHTADNLEKLGDYPVYTAQQALWVMQSDRVPEEVRMPEGAEVVKVELSYSNLVGYTAVIPYYEFVIKTDEIDYWGELIYKHYRIPAVPEQFLDMTIEDYGVRA